MLAEILGITLIVIVTDVAINIAMEFVERLEERYE